LLAERARADAAQTKAAIARAEQSDAQALIVHLKLQIEKLRQEIFGPRSERSARLLDQMELQLEELEASATEDERKAETAATKTTNVAGFSRTPAGLPGRLRWHPPGDAFGGYAKQRSDRMAPLRKSRSTRAAPTRRRSKATTRSTQPALRSGRSNT
jgi:hypothetical protein